MYIGILDIETTGFLNNGGLIVEVGLVGLNLETGEIKPVFESLVKESGFSLGLHYGSWIFQNSNLLARDVARGPSSEIVFKALQNYIDESADGVTAYNNKFDFSFLEDRGLVFQKKLLDPMELATPVVNAKNKMGKVKWPTVEESYRFLIEPEYTEKHRAFSDAWDEAKIVYKLHCLGHSVVPEFQKPPAIPEFLTRDFKQFNVAGFSAILWDSVGVGDVVYIKGTENGNWRAYGPHNVESVEQRTLKNSAGRVFFEPLEMLLKKDEVLQ